MSAERLKNISRINAFYKKGNFESVIKESKSLIISELKSRKLLYIIALAYDQAALKKKGRLMNEMQKKAKKYAHKIIKNFPKWDKGYFVAGLISQHSGSASAAVKFYKKAQKINPNNPSYYLSLGNGYRAMKNYRLAKLYYKKVLKIKSIRHLACINLVSLYEEINKKNLIREYAKQSVRILKNKKDIFSQSQMLRMKKIIKSTVPAV